MRRKRALITGGSGYLGGYLVEHFLAAGFEVYATYFSRRPSAASPARWLRWDMRDKLEVPGVKFDLVLHNASTLSCDPAVVLAADVGSFFNLQPAAAGAFFVYISSMDVFSPGRAGPVAESSPCAPGNWYGFGKQCVENALRTRSAAGGPGGFAIIRAPYVLSAHPRQLAGFWGRLTGAIGRGAVVSVRDIPPGQLARNGFSWVDPAYLSACAVKLCASRASGIFHASNGFMTWKKFFEAASEALGKAVRVKYAPGSVDGFLLSPDHRRLSSRRMAKVTGLRPGKTFSSFIVEMLASVRGSAPGPGSPAARALRFDPGRGQIS